MLKKALITPALPQARQDAPLPELCSRVAQRLNVPPTAKSLSLGRLADGRVIRVRLGISLAAAALKAFLNILHSHRCFDQRSTTSPLEIAPQAFFYSQLARETPVRRNAG
jgi:hypothetical protein